MAATSPNFVVSGNIRRSTFVKQISDYTVAQAGSGDQPIGVSFEGQEFPPGMSDYFAGTVDQDTQYAGVSGYPMRVYGLGEICLIQAGAAIVTGNPLIPTTNGLAIPWVATGGLQYPAAIALESTTVSGAYIRCQVIPAMGTRGSG